jgi:DNA helicase IV
MNQDEKNHFLTRSRVKVREICDQLEAKQRTLSDQVEIGKDKFKKQDAELKLVQSEVLKHNIKRISELNELKDSPYFVKCFVTDKTSGEQKVLAFGKFGSSEEGIYSWVTPAAEIRFDEPGDVAYQCPDGTIERLVLNQKDQYLIANKEIKFLATEKIGTARELIFQEYFSNRKTSFILPEIVAEMEKSQDTVIRANHLGPFLISGPAGSGKTTLALHRIAYLIQSPDLTDLYNGENIIVFVQDNSTKAYFSTLLPSLGIDNVTITTFPDWAFSILDLTGSFSTRFGNSEAERDQFEYRKIEAMRAISSLPTELKNYDLLDKIYEPFFAPKDRQIFKEQKSTKSYDRIDLTILLMAKKQQDSMLYVNKDYYVEQKNGQYKKKHGPVLLKYSLVLIDEFQNYLPEQLKLFKSCQNQSLKSIIYVGDINQQIRLGTIRDWSEIHENIEMERRVVLNKVYRNTKEILSYINSLGYNVEIPEKLKNGDEVKEIFNIDTQDQIEYVERLAKNKDFQSLGILAQNDKIIEPFRQYFKKDEKIHSMTITEAQGVEFDIVVLVGIDKTMFDSADTSLPTELVDSKKRIDKDLLYIGLTRAISELHLIGEDKLSSFFKAN